MTSKTIETALRLIVALARLTGISPEVLAEEYLDTEGCQEFFDHLVFLAEVKEQTQ